MERRRQILKYRLIGREILQYGLIGIVTLLGYGALSWYWLRAVSWVLGHEIVFDTQPPAVRALQHGLDAVPWVIAIALLVWGLSRRRLIPVLAYAGGFFALPVAVLLSWPIVSDYSSRIPFDGTTWRQENTQPQGLRVRMVDDLLRQHSLVGMTRGEVNALLGVPPKTEYFSEYEYVYWLGPERGFISIDSEWLALRFRDDRAVEARVVRD